MGHRKLNERMAGGRTLRMESLEDRAMLSLSAIASFGGGTESLTVACYATADDIEVVSPIDNVTPDATDGPVSEGKVRENTSLDCGYPVDVVATELAADIAVACGPIELGASDVAAILAYSGGTDVVTVCSLESADLMAGDGSVTEPPPREIETTTVSMPLLDNANIGIDTTRIVLSLVPQVSTTESHDEAVPVGPKVECVELVDTNVGCDGPVNVVSPANVTIYTVADMTNSPHKRRADRPSTKLDDLRPIHPRREPVIAIIAPPVILLPPVVAKQTVPPAPAPVTNCERDPRPIDLVFNAIGELPSKKPGGRGR